ncbi:GNAT family N-acetyltransferase [Vibrio sp. ZSDZ65]|uniref:GNAT family N-acetyltransferase n=1 Tax=Vibrio qingdaonensis TaxID=2829491 RepID=A0A9X3CJS9_9VIBR|nr:GNAT family N-acetyltransferase [Vibrio qingdaonensis]MCW8344672.1 GNAT family N-acetyltransferase [Vibrio qingdaonensis]
MLTIEPLNEQNFEYVLMLSVPDEQRPYIGYINEIIDQSCQKPEETQWVICQAGKPVGFFLLDSAYANRYSFCPQGSIGFRSFLIDQQYQGQGIAKRAIRQIQEQYMVWLGKDQSDLYLTVNCKNALARSLYVKAGFMDTEQLYLGGEAGPQHIMCFKSKKRG